MVDRAAEEQRGSHAFEQCCDEAIADKKSDPAVTRIEDPLNRVSATSPIGQTQEFPMNSIPHTTDESLAPGSGELIERHSAAGTGTSGSGASTKLKARVQAVLNWIARGTEELVDIERAGLMATAPIAPLLAAIGLFAAGLNQLNHVANLTDLSFLAGLLALLAAWLMVATLFAVLGGTYVKRANTTAYCELANRLAELKAANKEVCDDESSLTTLFEKQVSAQFHGYLNHLQEGLDCGQWSRVSWVLGTGYLSAWQMVHRSQEALINIEPDESVALRARYDMMRLFDSNLPNHKELYEALVGAIEFMNRVLAVPAMDCLYDLIKFLEIIRPQLIELISSRDVDALVAVNRQLDAALAIMPCTALSLSQKVALTAPMRQLRARECDPKAELILPDALATICSIDQVLSYVRDLPARQHTGRQAGQTIALDPKTRVLRPPESMLEARMLVGAVRETVNRYRDTNLSGLVRARIHLACTTTTAGVLTYAGLALVIAAASTISLGPSQLVAGATYYVVGALVGLFGRLNAEVSSDTAVDDFGLTATRLFAAPQLSGIAAVLGVGLLALTGVITHFYNAFYDTFTLENSTSVVIAAVFGLTPSLLIERLKQQTDDMKKNLRSTQA
jgi:hypothetical protein